MAGQLFSSPDLAISTFKRHLNKLLHTTVVQAPLSEIANPTGVVLEFRQHGAPVCVPVGRSYHLFIGQVITTVKESGGYRLRTLAYAYKIAEGPSHDHPWIFRWEYNSRELKMGLHPRHHLHIPVKINCFDRRVLDGGDLHIPSGWVTVEEIIRFLINELRVKPKSANWDEILRRSEQKFREWTSRSV